MTLLRVPKFYPEFRCVGSACSDNCCIGWEINIDPKTLTFYKSVQGPLGDFWLRPGTADLQTVAGLAASGELRTDIGEVYPFGQFRDAFVTFEARATRGKTVIEFEGSS